MRRSIFFHKRHPPIGSRPGTLMLPDSAPPTRMTVIHYTADAVQELEIGHVREIPAILAQEGVTWIDVQGLGDEGILRALGEAFSIHPLALESIVNAPQRPKTESHESHELYIGRMVQLRDGGVLDMEQVSVLFAPHYVVTFQERYGDVLDPVRQRIRQGKGPIRRAGGDYLAYGIIDALIDHYFPVLEHYGELLEHLEDEIIVSATSQTLQAINAVKRSLLRIRRGVAPQRDAINSLVRGDSAFVTEHTQLYFRDCYNHCVQVTDVLESYRETAGAMLSTYLSAVSNRTNDVMKVLTIMASIFIPLTFMAGLYGMNFQHMPELAWMWSYPMLLAAMVVVAVGMLVFFRRRGWLGGGGSNSPGEEEDA